MHGEQTENKMFTGGQYYWYGPYDDPAALSVIYRCWLYIYTIYHVKSFNMKWAQYSFCVQVNPLYCHPESCAIGPVYQPPIPPDMTYFATSAFVYGFDNLNAMYGGVFDEDGFAKPEGVLEAARHICSLVCHLYVAGFFP